jgi:type II secretory pathway pseudopilin PulG
VIAALRRRLAADESGISMVEMLIAMMISGVLLAMVATMFLNVARATTDSNLTRESATAAGNIANQLGKTIRFATQNRVPGQLALDPAVVAGTPNTLTLLTVADVNPATLAPAMVRYTVQSGRLVEERWPASGSAGAWTFSAAGVALTRTLGETVVPAGSGERALFSYFDASGTELIPGATGLTATQRDSVASIGVTLRVRAASSAGGPVTVLRQTVGMPNLRFGGGTP